MHLKKGASIQHKVALHPLLVATQIYEVNLKHIRKPNVVNVTKPCAILFLWDPNISFFYSIYVSEKAFVVMLYH